MTRLVILPGLDGSARLRHEFTSVVARYFTAVDVIAYPPDIALDYADLQTWVRDRLPADEDFVLLGESFSGPVAIRLAAERQRGLVAMVLAASFATSPVFAAGALKRLVTLTPVQLRPRAALSWFLLGKWRSAELLDALGEALDQVLPRVIRQRLRNVLAVDATDAFRKVVIPTLYLRATADRVVPARCGEALLATSSQVTVVEIEGPHMLLETAPLECADAIAKFLGQLG